MIQSWQSFAYGVIATYAFSMVLVALFALTDRLATRHSPKIDARTEPGLSREEVARDVALRQQLRDRDDMDRAINLIISETKTYDRRTW